MYLLLFVENLPEYTLQNDEWVNIIRVEEKAEIERFMEARLLSKIAGAISHA